MLIVNVVYAYLLYSLIPRLSGGGKVEPGTDCVRMRAIN